LPVDAVEPHEEVREGFAALPPLLQLERIDARRHPVGD
jgi:hypothetical protein